MCCQVLAKKQLYLTCRKHSARRCLSWPAISVLVRSTSYGLEEVWSVCVPRYLLNIHQVFGPPGYLGDFGASAPQVRQVGRDSGNASKRSALAAASAEWGLPW